MKKKKKKKKTICICDIVLGMNLNGCIITTYQIIAPIKCIGVFLSNIYIYIYIHRERERERERELRIRRILSDVHETFTKIG
jgi:hypothetical protein